MQTEIKTETRRPERRFIHVKVYKRNTGVSCMHCGRPAKVLGVDATSKRFRHNVRYCHEHAIEMGAIEAGDK